MAFLNRLSIPVVLPMVALLLLMGTERSSAQAQPYRLLVVVTPASYNHIGSASIRTRINSRVVSNTNSYYAASPINAVAQLAGIVRVNYSEVAGGISPDLDSLTAWANNSSNAIYKLRNLYAADVVTMVEANTDWTPGVGGTGGIGWVYSTSNYAYTCINYDAIINYPVAAHEIGHNFGCHHDTAHDNRFPGDINESYPYSFGLILTDGNHGTIMSYPTTYINYFANPDSNWNGMSRGRTVRCNTTLVHKNRISTIAGFRNAQTDISISNQNWKANEFGDVTATDTIGVSGVDSVKDSAEVWLRATNRVTIKSGFTVTKNGSLTIRTGSGALAKKRIYPISQQNGNGGPAKSEASLTKLTASIIQNGNLLQIHYEMPDAGHAEIKIFSIDGRLILSKSLGNIPAGWHTENVCLFKTISANMYLIQVCTDRAVVTKKMFVLK